MAKQALFIGGMLLLIWSGLTACQPGALTVAEYVRWAEGEESGLKKARKMGALSLETHLLPPAYQMLRLMGPRPEAEAGQEMMNELAQSLDIQLNILPEEGKGPIMRHQVNDPQQYQERVQFMAFEMEKNLYLLHKGDTLRPALYHWERGYDLSPGATCMLTFEKPEELAQAATLVLDDKIWGMGPVHFRLNLDALDRLPVLHF